ncbi:MAG: hypothetical protein LBL86_12195 [Coriobacteriales bacterium]|nr:hypothetical protein [Coriobacteriales bacterium]
MSQYLTYQQYTAMGGHVLAEDDADGYLTAASSRVDGLTFNRIVLLGIDALTPFQQELVRLGVKEQADFEYENADVIGSALAAYSINGVSVSFGGGLGVEVIDGVAVRRSAADALRQTGLMCRSFNWRRQ